MSPSAAKSVARRFLEWFGREADDYAKEGCVYYAPGTDYVERYVSSCTGAMVNAVDFVTHIASQRLGDNAPAVVEAAKSLLRP